MALRLSAAAPELAATPAPDTVALPTQPGAAGTKLRLEARAALAARDVHAYSALFPRADDIEDIHRRHQARLALLEVGLHESPADLPVLAGAMAVVARRAIELLEAEPREPGVPERRGRRLLRARRAGRGRAPLPGRAPAGPGSRARREQPRPAPGPPPRAPAAAAAPARRPRRDARPGPARQARRRRRAPGRGPHAEPVHDRQGRGGDAPALPRRRPRRRRRARHRRHRLEGPHAGDRARVRREAHRLRVDRLVQRRPQRLLRRRDAATGSCSWTRTRSSSRATASACAP